MRSLHRSVLLALLVTFAGALVAEAQTPTPSPVRRDPALRRPTGLSLSVTSVEPASRNVQVEVTLTTASAYRTDVGNYVVWGTSYGSLTPSTIIPGVPFRTYATHGLLGSAMVNPAYGLARSYMSYYESPYHPLEPYWAPEARLVEPAVAAVDWGDGQAIGATTVPLVVSGGPQYGTFRGSFSHTYPSAANYQLTAAAASLWATDYPIAPTTTGPGRQPNPDDYTGLVPPCPRTTVTTAYGTYQSPVPSAGCRFVLSFPDPGYFTLSYWGTQLTGYNTGTQAMYMARAARAAVSFQLPGVPTAGAIGLLLLAAALGVTGVLLLRR